MRIKLLILAFIFTPICAFAGLSATAVQTATGHGEGAASFTITLSSTPVAGNFMILGVGSGQGSLVVTSSNTTWEQVGTFAQGTSTTVSSMFIGRPRASAGTTITVALSGGGNFTAAGVVGEYPGIRADFDKEADKATGTGASPAVTISAGTYATELLFATITSRGTWATSGQTLYSSPTNSFSIVGQQNSSSNSSNADRAVVLLIKLVTSSGSVSAGVTGPGGNTGATGSGVYEQLPGFLVQ